MLAHIAKPNMTQLRIQIFKYQISDDKFISLQKWMQINLMLQAPMEGRHFGGECTESSVVKASHKQRKGRNPTTNSKACQDLKMNTDLTDIYRDTAHSDELKARLVTA